MERTRDDEAVNDRERLDGLNNMVNAFARAEVEATCRRVIYRLQRLNASGIFGDDFSYKSVWDEFCHEAQEGPHEMLETAWDSLITPVIVDAIEKIPHETSVLLSYYAGETLDDVNAPIHPENLWFEGIAQVVESSLRAQAMNRNL